MTILAPIGAAQGQAQGAFWMQLLFLGAFIAMMYLILIRPAHKRQKALHQMQESLESGSRVVTSGGLKGTVVKVEKDSVKLRIADNVKVDVTRTSIVSLEEKGDPSSGSS